MKNLKRIKSIKNIHGCLGGLNSLNFSEFSSIDNINKVIDEIIDCEYDLPNNYVSFMLKNDYEISVFVHSKIKNYVVDTSYKIPLIAYGLYNPLEDMIQAETYCNLFMAKFYSSIPEIMYSLRDKPNIYKPFNELILKIGNFKELIDYHGMRELKDYLLSMCHNESFSEIDGNDIHKLLLRIKNSDINLRTINKEEIEVLLKENSVYLPNLRKSSLGAFNVIKPYLQDKDLFDIKKALALFDEVDSTKYLIDTLNEMNEEALFELVIKACKKGYLKDGKDIRLVANKIKYGEKFRTIKDFAYLIIGSDDIKIKDSYISKLISIKKSVSKNFFKSLIKDDELIDISIKFVDVDILAKLNKILEFGQLNKAEYMDLVKRIMDVKNSYIENFWDFNFDFKISYQEFCEVFDMKIKKIEVNMDNIKSLKPNVRLLKLKEIKEIQESIKSESYLYDRKEILQLIENKNIKQEMRTNNPLDLSDIASYLNYIYLTQKFEINNIDDYRKYVLASSFVSVDDLKDKNIDEIILNCKQIQDIMNLLDLSEEFKATYYNEIFNFLISDNFKLVYGYFRNRNVEKPQLDSLALIAKSLIANKYDELKFVKDDIKKEAGTDLSDVEFENWKRTDEVSYKSYNIKDESDFKYIMRMGDIPVRSCMNYESGMYSKCLLSNFDTTKKMLTIHKNGRYVGRAIIRLTKMSDKDYINENNELSFIDVDNTVVKEVVLDNKAKNKEEELILFLEKHYTTLDKNDLVDLYDTLIDFLKNKAESIGAKLVVSTSYEELAVKSNSKFNFEDKHVFITASKNGYQYLDSFDGSTTKSYCYKKGKVLIY